MISNREKFSGVKQFYELMLWAQSQAFRSGKADRCVIGAITNNDELAESRCEDYCNGGKSISILCCRACIGDWLFEEAEEKC